MHLQTQFQFNRLNITKVFDALHDTYLWFSERASNYQHDFLRNSVLSAVRDKLKKYVEDGAQPAMSFYKAARLFDPYFFTSMNQNF